MAASFGLSDTGARFSPIPLRGGEGSGAASAAGLNPFAAHLEVNTKNAPRFDEMADTWQQTQSAERQQVTQSEGNAVAAGVQAYGQTAGAELRRRGMVEAAEAQASATKSSAMMGMVGKIASTGLSLLGGGLA